MGLNYHLFYDNDLLCFIPSRVFILILILFYAHFSENKQITDHPQTELSLVIYK